MEMLLNTVRMVDNDQFREYAIGDDVSLRENLAICFINPEDFDKLQISPNQNVKLSNNSGSVIVKPLKEKNVPSGMIIMPVSIWANQLTRVEKKDLIFKNIKVNIEPANDVILGLQDLLKLIRGS